MTQPSARRRRSSRRRCRRRIAPRGSRGERDRPFYAYSTNCFVDLEHAVIADVEATAPIRQAEAGAAMDMIVRTRERFGLYPEKLVADTAYGSAGTLGWLVESEWIEPHIPVIDKSHRTDGTFSREDFIYDRETDSYSCPSGKTLLPARRAFQTIRPAAKDDGTVRHRREGGLRAVLPERTSTQC
jgi:hypothetical protein